MPQLSTMIVCEMQTYYQRRAPEYDSSMGYDNPEKVALLYPIILDLQSMLQNCMVLELACGPCFWTQFIAEVSCYVKATDYNQSTLIEATKKPLAWDRVDLEVADAYDLNSIDGAYNAVFAADWFSHVPLGVIPSFLEHVISRVPAGSPIIFIDQLPRPDSLTDVFDDQGNHIQERILSDKSSYRVIKNFFSDSDYQDFFSMFSGELTIKRFSDLRRILVQFITS